MAEAARLEKWEMGITREEFLRLLPHVGPFELRGNVATGIEGAIAWQATFEPRAPRRIAGLSIPVLAVNLEVRGEGAPAFIDRFLLAYQRAGG